MLTIPTLLNSYKKILFIIEKNFVRSVILLSKGTFGDFSWGALNRIFFKLVAVHDELEPNLKKILHINGIWALEAIVM